jgi:uncharacterized membrane protein required for colicin V production
MNWIDLVIIILFVLNVVSGYQTGLIAGATELVSLFISLFFAVVALPAMAGIFHSTGFSINMSLFFGFGFIFVLVQIVLALLTMPITKRLKRRLKDTPFGTANRVLGPIPHIIAFFITTSFILAAFLVFPIFSPIKSAVMTSHFGVKFAAPAVNILHPVANEFEKNAQSSVV